MESAETKQAKKTILPEAAAKDALSRRPVDPREYDVVFEEVCAVHYMAVHVFSVCCM